MQKNKFGSIFHFQQLLFLATLIFSIFANTKIVQGSSLSTNNLNEQSDGFIIADSDPLFTSDTTTVDTARTHVDITSDGGQIKIEDGKMHYYYSDGSLATNIFLFDGAHTYYMQADGTPMTDRLTYHPDGKHIIYFDNYGHELFNSFQYCKTVGYTCYFDSQGYLYKDQITFVDDKVYYLDENGRMKQNEWFQFANGRDFGCANANGSLTVNKFGYDPYGRVIFYHWNGMVARGLITDGAWYYLMDEKDGHLCGQFPNTSLYQPPTVEFNPSYTGAYPVPATKKGLQGYTGTSLGVNHTLFNLDLSKVLNGSTPFEYKGKTYYFTAPISPYTIHICNQKGMNVSMVILLTYNSELVYPSARDGGAHTYYAWNTAEAEGRETLEAALHFLAQTYGNENCHVDNWILGNEVNMPNQWNYTGSMDLSTNVNIYADEFLMLHNAVKSYSKYSRISISLTNSFNHNDEGRGFTSKEFLDSFAYTIGTLQSNVEWCIAFHAYPAILTNPMIWSSSYTTNSLTTPFISCANLNVFTDYVRDTYGPEHRISISEVGFTATYGEAIQEAGIAYSYYAAECNNMVDAIIFRAYQDASVEVKQGLSFGLIGSDGNKRSSYEVFRHMDTIWGEGYTYGARQTIGIDNWNRVIPNYDIYAYKFRH